jgi:hypothetical protein
MPAPCLSASLPLWPAAKSRGDILRGDDVSWLKLGALPVCRRNSKTAGEGECQAALPSSHHTCRLARLVRLSEIVFHRCGFFTAAKCRMRTPRFTVQLGRRVVPN